MTVDAKSPPIPDGPLRRAGIRDRAVLYRELFKASNGRLAPSDVRELQIWESAVLLGMGDELKRSEGPPQPGASKETFHEYAARKIAERERAVAEGRPEPEPAPFNPGTLPRI